MESEYQSWTVGVLCFNEEGSIQQVYGQLNTLMPQLAGNDYEIIFIDDGSNDRSSNIIEDIAIKNSNVVMVKHANNLGIGQAILSVHRAATKENLCVISADGETNLDELLAYKTIETNSFVSFYREALPSYGGFRKLLTYANKLFNRLILGMSLKDVNWTKIYKTKDVQSLSLKLSSSLVESEICFKLIKKGIRPIEVPSTYLSRIAGEEKGASLKIVSQAMIGSIRLIVESCRLRFSSN